MFRSLPAAVLAAAMFAFAALQAAPAAAQQFPPDTVVAKVGDSDIQMQDMVFAMEALPAQYRGTPLQTIFGPLLQQMVERRLVARAAAAQGLADDPEVQRRLLLARDSILERVYLTRKVEAATTPEKLRERYEAESGAATGQDEVRARHILLKCGRGQAPGYVLDVVQDLLALGLVFFI